MPPRRDPRPNDPRRRKTTSESRGASIAAHDQLSRLSVINARGSNSRLGADFSPERPALRADLRFNLGWLRLGSGRAGRGNRARGRRMRMLVTGRFANFCKIDGAHQRLNPQAVRVLDIEPGIEVSGDGVPCRGVPSMASAWPSSVASASGSWPGAT